ncbi:MAG: LysR substrate-binding domain-containing protein [Ornithinimicrobium sp.]
MTTSIPPLLGLQAYEAAARRGGFALAAEELHLSPSAVSQRVRTLEAHLGVQLFERLPRSLRLTEFGHAYLPAVRDIFEELSAATNGLFGASKNTQLTVRVQVSYATTWLAPRLRDFNDTFDHISLRLLSAVWADALPPDEIDLEIRQGNGNWPGFIATKLHDDFAVVICDPQLLQGGPTLSSASELREHGRVHVLGFDDLWSRLSSTNEWDDRPEAVLTLDTSIAAIAAIADRGYWTIVPERFARQAVHEGRVAMALDALIPMRQSHYLLRRDDGSQLSGAAAAFAQWIRTQDTTDVLGAHPDQVSEPRRS